MSRRTAVRRAQRSKRDRHQVRVQPRPWDDLHEAHWQHVSWWWDEIPGYEPYTWSQWQDAWADLTLKVVSQVWRKQGARIYAAQKDAILRDDLQSWLAAQAQELATYFSPEPWHPAPPQQWAAYLHNALTTNARWHFQQAVGRREADQDAYNRGIASLDHLNEMEAETGYSVERHPLHGFDIAHGDPEAIVIRVENLTREVTRLEAEERDRGTYTTTSATGTCLINLCTRPVTARGLCKTHYNKERLITRNLEHPCNVPDCGETHHARGLCIHHYPQWLKGTLPEELHQYVEAEARKRGPQRTQSTHCTEPGCENPAKARSLCSSHYERQRYLARKGAPKKEAPTPTDNETETK